jgi:hypothetical protein
MANPNKTYGMDVDAASPPTTLFVKTWVDTEADYKLHKKATQLQLELVKEENKRLVDQLGALRSRSADNKVVIENNAVLINVLRKHNKRQEASLLEQRQAIQRHLDYQISTELWFDIKINQVKQRDRTIKNLTTLEETNRKKQRDLILTIRSDNNNNNLNR